MSIRPATPIVLAALLGGIASGTLAPALRADVVANVLTGYRVTSWTERDGLPSAVVRAVIQDVDRYVWVGTDAGLVRFDGLRFTPAAQLVRTPFPDAPVRVLLAGRDGSVWVGLGGAQGGVVRILAGEAAVFGPAEGLLPGQMSTLLEDSRGTIWAGSDAGLFRWDGARWHHTLGGLLHAPVFSLHEDRRGRFLAGTALGLFERRPGHDSFVRAEPFESAVRSIEEDAAGRIWVADPLVGFRRLGEQKTPSRAVHEGRGHRLLFDTRGSLWVGTRGHGLWRVAAGGPSTGDAIEKSTALTGLSNDGVEDLLEDHEGNIWVATTDGLNCLTPHKATQITNLGLVNGIEVAPDGRVWVGTVDGLVSYSKGTLDQPREQLTLTDLPLLAMHADRQGAIWLATARRLLRVAGGQVSDVPPPAARAAWTSIASDATGRVWLHDQEGGLFTWQHGHIESIEVPTVDARDVRSIQSDTSGRIWLMLADDRVAVVSGHGVKTYGPANGLRAGPYRAVLEGHDGTVWLGGQSGLSRLRDGTFVTVGREQGFPAGMITAIVEDAAGTLWLGLEGTGLVRLRRAEFEQAAAAADFRIHCTLYDRSDGLAGTPRWFAGSSAKATADGRIWFVSGRGLTVIDPDRLARLDTDAVEVRIESFVADGARLPLSAELSLPAGTARLAIDYTALNFASPLKSRFRYRLDGFDPDWIDAGTRRQAVYTNLPPGEYRFQVAASNFEGVWAAPASTAAIAIEPAFHQTIWFYLLCFASATLAVASVWRFHLRQIRKRFALVLKERARLSREIHDTLLQSMVGVALQFDAVAADLDASPAMSKERLVRMRKDVEEYIREARQSIWDLRSPTLEKCDLATALKQAGEHATAGTRVRFEAAVAGAPRRLAPQVEEQLLRIGQEAVVNALRHARAETVRLELRYEPASVALKISDDGSGFDLTRLIEEGRGHYGLTTMRERAEEVGGALSLESAVGRGTRVSAVVPAPGSARG